MKRLSALLLALLMLFSALTAFAEPVSAEEDFEEIEEIEIVPVEEAVEEEELELEPAEAEPLPEEEILVEEEALSGEEEIPEELPEEELTVEEDDEVPEDGNEAAEGIFSQPRDITVFNGDEASFAVGTTGATALQWQWRADSSDGWKNTQLNGYDKNMLSFKASMGMNGRQYRCLVTDSGGTTPSNPATLTVTDKLTIAQNPYNCITPAGGTASFSVEAVGKGLKYQWQWRAGSTGAWANTSLNGYNKSTLSFTASEGMNARQYRCVVIDANNSSVASGAATLTIKGLKIVNHPADVTVSESATAKFTVKALGSGLKYQWKWRANSSEGWKNTGLNGYNTAALSFPVTMGMTGREYCCEVSNVDGTLYSNPAKLTVVAAPKITAHPAGVTVGEGGTAKFTVAASGSGLKYQWQWRAGSSGAWADTGLNGYNTATLSFAATSGMNGRHYRCKVTGGGLDVFSNAATLTVIAAPKITAHPQSAKVQEDSPVSFTVAASGSGLKYQWQWRADSSGTWANTSLSGATSAKLSFTAAAGMNKRQYRCGVTNIAGTVWSNPATLTVGDPATITQQPKSSSVFAGNDAAFTVKASGKGLQYQWKWRASASDTWKDTGMKGCKTDKLTVEGASVSLSGRQFCCVVTDKYGNVVWSSAATLTVTTSYELSNLLTMSASARTAKLTELGFTIFSESDPETGDVFYRAYLYVGDGSIHVDWDYMDGESICIGMEGFNSPLYTLELVNLSMSVSEARSRLETDGWDFGAREWDEEEAMASYWYHGQSGSRHYSYSIDTYDEVHIAYLYEYMGYE